MQLQFEKSNIRCLRSVVREVRDHEETQEIRIDDDMCDIGQVLGCWGQVVVRGKEWRSSGICINGGIIARVLYVPEDDEEMQWVEAWIPYQVKIEFSDNERDGGIVVQPLLRSIDARIVSARKLMLRADIGVLCDAMVDDEIEFLQARDVPDDVCLLEESYLALLPKEMNEKTFLIDDTVSASDVPRGIEKVIYYHLQPVVNEYKVMGDKIIFRGEAHLHTLCLNNAGQLLSWDTVVPFSQFSELGREYSDDAIAKVVVAVTSVEFDRGEGDSFRLRVGLTGQYIIYDRECITVMKDAYSPKRSVHVTTVPIFLPTVLDVSTDEITADCKLNDQCSNVIDSVFYPHHTRVYKDGDRTTSEHCGTFHYLCQNADGSLCQFTERWENTDVVDADEKARTVMTVSCVGSPRVMTSGMSMMLSCELSMASVWFADMSVPMVTGLDIGECESPDPERPGLVLKRVGEGTLWDVAKEFGSTVELIKEVNGLQGEPDAGRMLILPIV